MRPPAFLVAFLMLCIGAAVFCAYRSAPETAPLLFAPVTACEDVCGCPPRPVTESCCCAEPVETAATTPAARTEGSPRARPVHLRTIEGARSMPARIAPWSCGTRPVPAAVASAGSGPAPMSNHGLVLAGSPHEEFLPLAPPGLPPRDLRREPETPPPRGG